MTAATLEVPPMIRRCDSYLAARTGKYAWRRVRYLAALQAMQAVGLSNDDTVVDVGAGWTELDFCLRIDGRWRGRYIAIDGGIDGVDLETWVPPRPAEFFVALELLEHLLDPDRLVDEMRERALRGIVISTPNPETTDVLGMDETHRTEITWEMLEGWGFRVREAEFYGQPADSLFGVWLP